MSSEKKKVGYVKFSHHFTSGHIVFSDGTKSEEFTTKKDGFEIVRRALDEGRLDEVPAKTAHRVIKHTMRESGKVPHSGTRFVPSGHHPE